MSPQPLTLRSTIQPALMRSSLMRGTCLAALGASTLLAAGGFLPSDQMTVWGLPLFLTSLTLITWGLLPYRRLRRLEMQPYQLTVDDEWLHFTAGGRRRLSIPWASIAKLDYCGKKRNYGIGIVLKKPLPEKIIVHGTNTGFSKTPWLTSAGCDIFMPYFSARSYQTLVDYHASERPD